MSLDVYLYETITCPHCGGVLGTEQCQFSANITHNLGRMAAQVPGLYEALWRGQWLSDLLALSVAEDADAAQRFADGDTIRAAIAPTPAQLLIEPLRAGLTALKADPARYRTFDAENGWGLYDNFVPWIERYLAACEEHPDAIVKISR